MTKPNEPAPISWEEARDTVRAQYATAWVQMDLSHDPPQWKVYSYQIQPHVVIGSGPDEPSAWLSAHSRLKDDKWIRDAAEREDNCLVSAGGLVSRLGGAEQKKTEMIKTGMATLDVKAKGEDRWVPQGLMLASTAKRREKDWNEGGYETVLKEVEFPAPPVLSEREMFCAAVKEVEENRSSAKLPTLTEAEVFMMRWGWDRRSKLSQPLPTPPVEGSAEELYYIQDMRSYCGNSVFWWRPEGNGYTTDLRKAWKVPKEKALRMMRHRPDVDKAWPCAAIDPMVETHFDMQNLRSLEPLKGTSHE